jgi:hypothetical protein
MILLAAAVALGTAGLSVAQHSNPNFIDIWGAKDVGEVSSDCGENGGSAWWAEIAKRTVIARYAKEGAAVFYDDTAANVMAALQLTNVSAHEVSRDDIGFLVEHPSTSMWHHLNGRDPPPKTAIFDFDLTLSDLHSSGTTLEVRVKFVVVGGLITCNVGVVVMDCVLCR